MPSPSDDTRQAQARAYRRMRRFATGLLGLMFAVYVAAKLGPASPWAGYVQAFAEAAMVGGMADWFAVTALFRRPLGLPIPHTGIVARNKDRIGESLGAFVANNFLVPDEVVPKLRSLDVAERLSRWLEQPGNARRAATRLAAAVPPVLASFDDARIRRLLRDTMADRLREMDVAPLLSRMLAALVSTGQHLALFDRLLDVAGPFVATNRDVIRARLNDKSEWWARGWITAKLADRIVGGVQDILAEMRAPDHPWRADFSHAVAGFITDLAASPAYHAKGEALKHEVIGSPQLQAYLESLWEHAKLRLLDDISSGGRLVEALEHQLAAMGRKLRTDRELQALLNEWTYGAVVNHIVPNRDQIGAFIAGVVRKWDTRTMVDKLELQVGRDLQYIRVNGTVVGGLVGLALHLFGTLVLR